MMDALSKEHLHSEINDLAEALVHLADHVKSVHGRLEALSGVPSSTAQSVASQLTTVQTYLHEQSNHCQEELQALGHSLEDALHSLGLDDNSALEGHRSTLTHDLSGLDGAVAAATNTVSHALQEVPKIPATFVKGLDHPTHQLGTFTVNASTELKKASDTVAAEVAALEHTIGDLRNEALACADSLARRLDAEVCHVLEAETAALTSSLATIRTQVVQAAVNNGLSLVRGAARDLVSQLDAHLGQFDREVMALADRLGGETGKVGERGRGTETATRLLEPVFRDVVQKADIVGGIKHAVESMAGG